MNPGCRVQDQLNINEPTAPYIIYNFWLPTFLPQWLKYVQRQRYASQLNQKRLQAFPQLRTFPCIPTPHCSCCNNRNPRSRYLDNFYIPVIIFASIQVLVLVSKTNANHKEVNKLYQMANHIFFKQLSLAPIFAIIMADD